MRRFRVINSFFLGALLSCVVCFVIFSGIAAYRYSSDSSPVVASNSSSPDVSSLSEYAEYRIASYISTASRTDYVFVSPDGSRTNNSELIKSGILVIPRGARSAELRRGDESLTLTR